MSIRSMDSIGVVVRDLDAAKRWFTGLGMTLVGETTVEGDWVERVVAIPGVRTQIALLQTPDGAGKVELMRYLHPEPDPAGDTEPPLTRLGMQRIAFQVDDLEATLAGLRERGTEPTGEVVRYEDAYLLAYVRGPEGIHVMLAEPLG